MLLKIVWVNPVILEVCFSENFNKKKLLRDWSRSSDLNQIKVNQDKSLVLSLYPLYLLVLMTYFLSVVSLPSFHYFATIPLFVYLCLSMLLYTFSKLKVFIKKLELECYIPPLPIKELHYYVGYLFRWTSQTSQFYVPHRNK